MLFSTLQNFDCFKNKCSQSKMNAVGCVVGISYVNLCKQNIDLMEIRAVKLPFAPPLKRKCHHDDFFVNSSVSLIYIDGLVQDCSISSLLEMRILQSGH